MRRTVSMLHLDSAIEDCGGEYMKPKISLFLSVIFITFLISPLYANAIEPLARPPIIATAIGDGAASDVLALVCEIHGIDYENILQLKPEEFMEKLDSKNAPGTLAIAPGAMVEGDLYTLCGVEEIDVGQEISRIELRKREEFPSWQFILKVASLHQITIRGNHSICLCQKPTT